MPNEAGTLVMYGPALITAGAIILSALCAGIGVFASVRHQRDIAKKRATLDLLIRSETDDFFTSANQEFHEVAKRGEFLKIVLYPKGAQDWHTRRSVKQFLNHYELIAIGIDSGILDEDFYDRWMKSVVVSDWNLARQLIANRRQKSDKSKVFSEFEKLAIRWGGDPLPEPIEIDDA